MENKAASDCFTSATMSLPDELITEILTRLPVKSLLRCKCICKEWLLLIETPDFVSNHWMRSSHVALPSEVLPDNAAGQMKTIGVCRGLLLERNTETMALRIRNPATRQVLNLPDPGWNGPPGSSSSITSSSSCRSEFLSYIECLKTFKVVSLYHKYGKRIGWAVLTLGNHGDDNLCWKNCKPPEEYTLRRPSNIIPEPLPEPHVFHVEEDNSIFNNIVKVCSILDEIRVLSFDLTSDELRDTVLPQDFWSGIVTMNKVVPGIWNNDLLSYGYVADDKQLHVLVLEDFRTSRWSNEIVFPLNFLDQNTTMANKTIWFAGRQGDLLKFSSRRTEKLFFTYNIKTKQVVEIQSEDDIEKKLELFRPTLLKLKGMAPLQMQI